MSLIERFRQIELLPKSDEHAESKRTANQFAQEYVPTAAKQMLETCALQPHQEAWMNTIHIPTLRQIQQVQAGTVPILHLGDRGYHENPDTVLVWQPLYNGMPLSMLVRKPEFMMNMIILPEPPEQLRSATHVRRLQHLKNTVDVQLSPGGDTITLLGKDYYYLGETVFQEHRSFHSWIRMITAPHEKENHILS